MTSKVNKSVRKTADHGEFGMMHLLMLQKFLEWIDEFSLRQHGFKLSELQSAESTLAFFVTSVKLDEEGIKERDRLIEQYREKWRPCRLKMMDG